MKKFKVEETAKFMKLASLENLNPKLLRESDSYQYMINEFIKDITDNDAFAEIHNTEGSKEVLFLYKNDNYSIEAISPTKIVVFKRIITYKIVEL